MGEGGAREHMGGSRRFLPPASFWDTKRPRWRWMETGRDKAKAEAQRHRKENAMRGGQKEMNEQDGRQRL